MVKRKKKRKLKKTGIYVLISLILLIVLGAINIKIIFTMFAHKEVPVTVIKKKPVEQHFKLIMGGDALIHGAVYLDARKGNGTYDFKPMLENIKPIVSKYDLAYYNQETVLGGKELGVSTYPRFNSPYEVGDAFIDAGFDLVSLANNHTMDRGEQAIHNSVNYWNNHKEIVTSGQWTSFEERNKERIYEKNGIKYAFFSYTTWTNGLPTPRGKEYLSNVYSYEKAKEDISKVRDKVDVVMVAMHWGIEYSFGVSSDQSKIAKELSDLGVDLIIGAHPHVVEPVEYINNGKTFVIYSLGNLISAQIGDERLTGLLMEVTVSKVTNIDGSVDIKIKDPKGELIYTKYNSAVKNFKVYPYHMLNQQILPNYTSYEKKFKNIVGSKCSDLTWGLSY